MFQSGRVEISCLRYQGRYLVLATRAGMLYCVNADKDEDLAV